MFFYSLKISYKKYYCEVFMGADYTPSDRPLEMNPNLRQLYLGKGEHQGDADAMKEMPKYASEDAPRIVDVCAKAFEDYHMSAQGLVNAEASRHKSKLAQAYNTVKIITGNPTSRSTLAPDFISKTSDNYKLIQNMVDDFKKFKKTLTTKELDSAEACQFSREEELNRENLVLYLNSTIVNFKRQNNLSLDSLLSYIEKPDSISEETWKQMIQFEGVKRFIEQL